MTVKLACEQVPPEIVHSRHVPEVSNKKLYVILALRDRRETPQITLWMLSHRRRLAEKNNLEN
jgi:hypothetical protein